MRLRPPSMRYSLLMHLVTLAWGLTAILGKLVALSAADLVLWRTLLAVAGFALLALALRAPLRLPARDARHLLGLGALLGLHWVAFFASARVATASVSLAALPTAMLWCSLLEPWINGSRRWRPLELFVGVIVVGAVWLIYEVEFRHWQGLTLGLLAALLAALFIVFSKQVAARRHYAVIGAWQMTGALIVTLAALPFAGAAPAWPATGDWPWLLVLSGVCTVGAYAGYMVVLRHLDVFSVNVIYNLEPVYGILLAMLVFGAEEKMTGGFYLGAALITGSVLLVPWLRRKGLARP